MPSTESHAAYVDLIYRELLGPLGFGRRAAPHQLHHQTL
jgi:hypothetical protein